jgi:hypothetical protein
MASLRATFTSLSVLTPFVSASNLFVQQPKNALVYSGGADAFGRGLAFGSSDLELFVGVPGKNLVLSFLRPNASAEWMAADQYLCAPTCSYSARFGTALAVANWGSVMVAGAPGDDNGFGKVFVYSRRANSTLKFAFVTVVVSPDRRSEYGSFGQVLRLSPDAKRLLVSAPGGLYSYEGSVHLYAASGSFKTWHLSTSISNPTGENLCYFGQGLALLPDWTLAVIGAPGAAIVHIYQFRGSKAPLLLANISASGINFGSAVDIVRSSTGNVFSIAVGAPGSSYFVFNGSVAVFSNATGRFQQTARISLGESRADYFGSAVAYDDEGETLIVGAPGVSNDDGKALVYSTSTWIAIQTLEPSKDISHPGAFGATIALWHNVSDVRSPVALAVSAPDSGSLRGATVTFIKGPNFSA